MRTVLSHGILVLKIDEFCDYIKANPPLQTAEIMSTETYSIRGTVLHRFLVLKIGRRGKKDLWLRIERRPDKRVTQLGLVSRGFTTQADDTVRDDN